MTDLTENYIQVKGEVESELLMHFWDFLINNTAAAATQQVDGVECFFTVRIFWDYVFIQFLSVIEDF